jgi:hypothetical protein
MLCTTPPVQRYSRRTFCSFFHPNFCSSSANAIAGQTILWITVDIWEEHANTPNPNRLLRVPGKRVRGHRTTKHHNELPS